MGLFGKSTKAEPWSLLFRQMASMLKVGMPLGDALDILGAENEDKGAERLADRLRREFENGEVSATYPAWLQPLFKAMDQSTLKGPVLAGLMEDLADDHEHMETLESRFLAALVYPVTVVLLATVITGVILVFVIPTFSEMFESFGSRLPEPTQLVVGISGFVTRFFFLLLAFFLAGALVIRFNKELRDRLLLFLPGIRQVVETLSAVKFSRYLAIMLRLKTSPDQAFETAVSAVPNSVHARQFREALAASKDAISVSAIISHSGLFSPMAVRLTRAAEQNGYDPADVLKELARYNETCRTTRIESSLKLFEVGSTVVIGLVIGFLVISMYLPIFKMAGAAG